MRPNTRSHLLAVTLLMAAGTLYPAGAELIVAEPNEPIRVVMDLKPVKTTQPKAGVLIFDMGQNMAGWCRARLSGQPGDKHFLIKPQPGGSLTWERGSYDSVHGKISSAWKLEEGKLTMDVTVPANTTATVSVPATDAASVTENGKPAGQAQGVKFLHVADGAAVYKIGSGSYHFENH